MGAGLAGAKSRPSGSRVRSGPLSAGLVRGCKSAREMSGLTGLSAGLAWEASVGSVRELSQLAGLDLGYKSARGLSWLVRTNSR